MKQILRTATLGFMDWPLVLDNAEIAINCAPLRDCGVSLFFLHLGYHPCVWPDVEHAVEHYLVTQEDVKTFVKRLGSTWTAAREILRRDSARSVAQANKHRRDIAVFAVGSRVLVRVVPKRRSVIFPIGLLSPKWSGPYVVRKQVSRSTYLLDLPGPQLWN